MNRTSESVVTTSWDDGHILDIKLAQQLNKYKIKGTFYVCPHNRQWPKKELLSNQEIIKLNQYHEIGAHTLTHPELPRIPLSEAKQEITGSKKYLENLLKKEINMFCYPKGLYNKQISKLVKQAGFTGARTIHPYQINPPADPFQMGTSNHTVNRHPFLRFKLAIKNLQLLPLTFSKTWLEESKAMFMIIIKKGGIFHFWGHSWQLEQEQHWENLDKLFKFISGYSQVKYLTNGQIISKFYEQTKTAKI